MITQGGLDVGKRTRCRCWRLVAFQFPVPCGALVDADRLSHLFLGETYEDACCSSVQSLASAGEITTWNGPPALPAISIEASRAWQ